MTHIALLLLLPAQLTRDAAVCVAAAKKTAWAWESNSMFNTQDAIVLHCMIRHFKPATVIEVGAGFSVSS